MRDSYCRLTQASFTSATEGLVWIDAFEAERGYDGESGDVCQFWLLVEYGTDRILATIDGPGPSQLTYLVAVESGASRRFISLEGAQKHAMDTARAILHQEKPKKRAGKRKVEA